MARSTCSSPTGTRGRWASRRWRTPVNAYATAFHAGEGPLRAIDGLSDKGFETCWSTWNLPLPQSITVDLGGVWSNISTLEYLPKQWNRHYLTDGDITLYTISTSIDGVAFTPVAAGTWAGTMATKLAEWPKRKAAFEVHQGTGGYANVGGLHIGGRRAEPVKVSEPPLAGGTYRLTARHSSKVASIAGTDIVQAAWSGDADHPDRRRLPHPGQPAQRPRPQRRRRRPGRRREHRPMDLQRRYPTTVGDHPLVLGTDR